MTQCHYLLIILFISKRFFHCHHSDTNAKVWVSLYRSGCAAVSILRSDPTTDRHGGFDLLRLRPGPVHPSLDDLVVPSSPRSTISIPNLVRTPDRHSPLQPRSPELKRSASLSLPVAWITGAATEPGESQEYQRCCSTCCSQRPLVQINTTLHSHSLRSRANFIVFIKKIFGILSKLCDNTFPKF